MLRPCAGYSSCARTWLKSLALLDVDQVYLEYENGGAIVINVDEIGSDAKKTMVEGREVLELCDDGSHRGVWRVPKTVDGDKLAVGTFEEV